MDGESVKRIEDLQKQALEIREIDGKKYSVIPLNRIYSDPRPSAIGILSLQGLVDYLDSNIDELNIDELLIHVIDHQKVRLITNIHGGENERHTLIYAKLEEIERFPFKHFIDQEEFIIKCKSMFCPSEDLSSIMKYTASIDTTAAVRSDDDGVSQNINVKKGISGVLTERENISPIVQLAPYRTFTEIKQPESEFLFRMRNDNGKATCALFDADGGAWKSTARSEIAAFLRNNTNVSVIA